jgi:hypothetical protein
VAGHAREAFLDARYTLQQQTAFGGKKMMYVFIDKNAVPVRSYDETGLAYFK